MAVFRVEKTKDFTVMSNYHLRDKNLSLKAKGLLSQMLSLPEEWDYTLAGLAHINKESKDAIRTAILELEKNRIPHSPPNYYRGRQVWLQRICDSGTPGFTRTVAGKPADGQFADRKHDTGESNAIKY